MAEITYYVVVSFVRNVAGDLVADHAIEMPSYSAAVDRAGTLAMTKAGAIAFSRTGDRQLGQFADAEVLFKAGEIPTDMFGKS